MKLVLDSCVWGPADSELRGAGHDVVRVSDWGQDPGDEAILARAFTEARIVVTLDKDFGTLAIFRRAPHAGIIRLVDVQARAQAGLCIEILHEYGDKLREGAIITADRNRIRVRPEK